MTFFEKHHDRLANFARVSGSVGARADYVQGGGGNTSVKLEGGLMAIKASGYCLKDIEIDKAYAVLDCTALREFYVGSQPSDFEDVEKAGSDKAVKAKKDKQSKPGIFARASKWLHELKVELKKVQWPSKKQTINNTAIVIICVLIVGTFIWVFDALANGLIGAIMALFGV